MGLVGGLGPASTVDYYLGLVEAFRNNCGDDVYPEIVIDSVNMTRHVNALSEGDYETVCCLLIESLSNLKAAGAELAAITANTEHIVWDMVKERFPLPVLSIAEAAVTEIKRRKFNRVLVFGTEFTMRSGLYEKALSDNGITPIVPSGEDIALIGKLIYPNLENGIVIPDDKQKMLELAQKYIDTNNADSMLLGCTELPLMIKPDDVTVPILDTTKMHIGEIFNNAVQA